ncbi:MAG TPA: FecR domain-containing protein [Steroidobacteraceae bacterium]|jgi:transmembrane sensor
MDNVHDEAAAWVARLAGQEPAAGERATFDDWLGRSPAHAAAYHAALQTWRDLAAMRSHERYRALLGTPTLRERIVGVLRTPRLIAAAVGVAAIVAVVWLGLSFDALSFLQRPTQVATQAAEVREIALPDGTRIVLGAQSQIDFTVTAKTRRATVIAGDAFFAVAHDPGRPFIVSTGDYTVRVVGTQFEIRRRPDQVRVAVSEGRVAVKRADTDDASSILSGGAAWIAAADSIEIRPVDALDVGAWRSGRLVYDNAALRDVVADANRYTRTHIVIVDPQLQALRLTTSFRTSQIDGMIETLQAALPLVAERQPDGDILLHARQ